MKTWVLILAGVLALCGVSSGEGDDLPTLKGVLRKDAKDLSPYLMLSGPTDERFYLRGDVPKDIQEWTWVEVKGEIRTEVVMPEQPPGSKVDLPVQRRVVVDVKECLAVRYPWWDARTAEAPYVALRRNVDPIVGELSFAGLVMIIVITARGLRNRSCGEDVTSLAWWLGMYARFFVLLGIIAFAWAILAGFAMIGMGGMGKPHMLSDDMVKAFARLTVCAADALVAQAGVLLLGASRRERPATAEAT